MTAPVRVCRACDELIEDPDDAVLVDHKPSNSGMGWDVYAHRGHASLVRPDLALMRVLAHVLVLQGRQPPG